MAACTDTAESATLSIEVDVPPNQLAWDPTRITIPAGSEAFIVVNNLGQFEGHDLVVASGGFSTEAEARSAVAEGLDSIVAKTEVIGPEESGSITIDFPESGNYQFFCSVPGHFAGGMHGTITVVDQ